MLSESSIPVYKFLLEEFDSAHWKRKSQKFSLSGDKLRHRHKDIIELIFQEKVLKIRSERFVIRESWNKLSPSCAHAVSIMNCNRLYLSAPKWEHMTLVVTRLRLNKAKEKRQTMYASNSLMWKLIIVTKRNSCHL